MSKGLRKPIFIGSVATALLVGLVRPLAADDVSPNVNPIRTLYESPDVFCASEGPDYTSEAIPYGSQTLQLHVNCASQSLIWTITWEEKPKGSAWYGGGFAEGALAMSLCQFSFDTALREIGWTTDIAFALKGEELTAHSNDCSKLEPLFTGINPPPAGTKKARLQGIPDPPQVTQYLMVELGMSVDQILAKSSPRLREELEHDLGIGHFISTNQPLNLTLREGNNILLLEGIGGDSSTSFVLDLWNGVLQGISFNYQRRPLNISEAIDRAKRVEAWLQSNPDLKTEDDSTFVLIGARDGKKYTAEAWQEVEKMLADEELAVGEMHLPDYIGNTGRYSITISNWKRETALSSLRYGTTRTNAAEPKSTIYDGNGGYEWGVQIYASTVF